MGLGESNIAFRVNSDVWIISFVGKEWRDTGSSTWNIVVSELHKE